MKASERKSTFTRKSKLLINPESKEYQDLMMLQNRRSRSTANINATESSEDEDSDDTSSNINDSLAQIQQNN